MASSEGRAPATHSHEDENLRDRYFKERGRDDFTSWVNEQGNKTTFFSVNADNLKQIALVVVITALALIAAWTLISYTRRMLMYALCFVPMYIVCRLVELFIFDTRLRWANYVLFWAMDAFGIKNNAD